LAKAKGRVDHFQKRCMVSIAFQRKIDTSKSENITDQSIIMHEIPSAIQQVLGGQWECLAFTAYDYYVRFGRIILGICKDSTNDDAPVLMAILYTGSQAEQQPEISAMLAAYDPERELLVQFEDSSGSIRTQRLRTKQDTLTPKAVYADRIMSRYEDDPNNVNLDRLPGWLRGLLSPVSMHAH